MGISFLNYIHILTWFNANDGITSKVRLFRIGNGSNSVGLYIEYIPNKLFKEFKLKCWIGKYKYNKTV